MKNPLLILAFVPFIISCQKDDLQPSSNQYQFPDKIGSYFIYQWFSIDSIGNEKPMDVFDTLTIVGTKQLNGYLYLVSQENYFGSSQKNEKWYRDSSGYIVDWKGQVIYSYVDFKNQLNEGEDFLFRWTVKMEQGKRKVITPAGEFNSLIRIKNVSRLDGTPMSKCGDQTWPLDYAYSSGLGLVFERSGYYNGFFHTCSELERRLIEYHIPEN